MTKSNSAFDVRAEALRQAIRATRSTDTAQKVVEVANVFERYLAPTIGPFPGEPPIEAVPEGEAPVEA